jgi:putative transposase
MSQRNREDAPDTLHHVYNRGIARRTVFESREDVRYFLSRLARVHRAGLIEILAFCFLTNHFHLIIRSSVGMLPQAMQKVLNTFVRWFNRGRKRDGPLFRSRFGSRRIHSMIELSRLLPYVDQNSRKARLVSHSELYPYGSARLFQLETGPRWHSRGLIEDLTCRMSGADQYSPSLYRSCFGVELTPAEIEWIELRINGPRGRPDPLDDLVGAAPARVRDWMIRKSKLADGSAPGQPLVSPSGIISVLCEMRNRNPDLRVQANGRMRDLWPLLTIGLLREECGLSLAATCGRLDRAKSTVSEAAGLHRRLLPENGDYADLAAAAMVGTMDLIHGKVAARLRS